LETPAAGEAEGFRAEQHEVDDALRAAGHVIADPEPPAAMFGLDRKQEAVGRRVFRRFGQPVVEVECAGRVLRRADIEQA